MKSQSSSDSALFKEFVFKAKIAYLKQVLMLQQLENEAANNALKMRYAKALRAALKKYRRRLGKRNYRRLMILEEDTRMNVERRREAILFKFKESLAKESKGSQYPHLRMIHKPNAFFAKRNL